MREYTVPQTVTVTEEENLTDMVWANAERFGSAVSFQRRVDGTWVDLTARDFAAHVAAVAKGLIAAGIRPGDRVALMSKTRYEWTLLDFAIWAAGGVVVPIYETSSAEQVEWIVSNSRATAVIVETAAHRSVVDSVVDRLSELRHVWQIEGPARPDTPGVVDELAAVGASVTDAELFDRRRRPGADNTATIIYTSGTTGRPKGCELTHGNFMVELGVAIPELGALFEADDASTLLFLPLAHVFARIVQVGAVKARVRLGHSADIKRLLPDLAEFQPTFILAVPRVFEKVFNTASQRATAEGR
ncbi:MAG TPA: AMP-binding protein, partial [Pseudonocardiaceae bacterium]|nr:AMP-binding protein [Pseudonocardiaceae bacterium]